MAAPAYFSNAFIDNILIARRTFLMHRYLPRHPTLRMLWPFFLC